MALSDILEVIRTQSDDTAEQALDEARIEAKKILDRAAAQSAAEEERLAASLDDQARLVRSQVMSRAHLETTRRRRAARERVFSNAVQAVTERVEDLRRSEQYEEVLASLLDEAIAILPDATTVAVDPADVEMTTSLLSTRTLDAAIEERACPLGGVVLGRAGRSVDNTLLTRIDRADEHLRFLAGEMLPELRGGAV